MTPTGEKAARARAARGYAGLNQKDMAAALGVSIETLSRMENAHRDISHEELMRIGRICGVPLSFMEFGFEVAADAQDGRATEVLRRLRDLEHGLAELRRERPDASEFARAAGAAFAEQLRQPPEAEPASEHPAPPQARSPQSDR